MPATGGARHGPVLHRGGLGRCLYPASAVRGNIRTRDRAYLGLLVLLRLTPAREAGSVDLLVMVLLADATQNAMAGPHHAVGDGLALIGTILVWSVTLDWAGYRWSFVHRLLRTPFVRLAAKARSFLPISIASSSHTMSSLPSFASTAWRTSRKSRGHGSRTIDASVSFAVAADADTCGGSSPRDRRSARGGRHARSASS